MQELSQRTSQFTDSVIRRMTRVSMKYDAINLSQGFPDFDPPAEITDRLAEVAHAGPHQLKVIHYHEGQGQAPLFEPLPGLFHDPGDEPRAHSGHEWNQEPFRGSPAQEGLLVRVVWPLPEASLLNPPSGHSCFHRRRSL